MSMEHVALHSIDVDMDLLADSHLTPGYIVASGGTMSQPKYLLYSFDEARTQSSNIAKNFIANGVQAGDRVVNYFTAGDMWSSFLLVDKAFSELPVTIFPLGCTGKKEFSLQILRSFRPNVIAGIPSMLVDLAQATTMANSPIEFQKVYYAGEPLSPAMEHVLSSAWGCELIRSAGYASTDVGAIGWQCIHCDKDEHFPFDDTIVEIIDSEIIVTSLSRRAMPFIRYRTGDRGEWKQDTCTCGGGRQKFRLRGRLDSNLIVWGCWIAFHDVAGAFEDLGIPFTALQLAASTADTEQIVRVRFEALEFIDTGLSAHLLKQIYERSGDLREVVSLAYLQRHMFMEQVEPGTLPRNPRTGKVAPIVDCRT
jgi:phenylacetate-coenzyme A ligase PaaK-like adenylate-forming protein